MLGVEYVQNYVLCNVIVQEKSGRSDRVFLVDPAASMQAVEK
jgi:hypothetical protein